MPTQWYVSAAIAPGSGVGSFVDPGNLGDALLATGWAAAVAPGDSIFARLGTYARNGGFLLALRGTEANPITVRAYGGPYPVGERATLDRLTTDTSSPLLDMTPNVPQWVTFRDLEFTMSNVVRIGFGGRVNATNTHAVGIKYINCIVHDTQGTAFAHWAEGNKGELTGCIAYYNGYDDQATGRGTGDIVYLQSSVGFTKLIQENIGLHSLGQGFQIFGSDSSSQNIDGITTRGNVSYQNGDLSTFFATQGYTHQLVYLGGLPPVLGAVIDTNYTYLSSQAPNLGDNEIKAQSPVITNNYFAHGTQPNGDALILLDGGGTPNITGNSFYGPLSGFTCNQYGLNICAASNPTSGKVLVVQPNPYEPGRAHLIVYNWDASAIVSINPNANGTVLNPGDTYQVLDSIDYYGTPVIGTTLYNGGNITLPMTGLTVATPVGRPAPAHTAPTFAAFILQRITAGPAQPRAAQVSWSEMQTPLPPRAAQVSWAEADTPIPARAAQVSFAEADAPLPTRAAQISFAEADAPANRRAAISFAEADAPLPARAAAVSWTEMQVPSPPVPSPTSGSLARLGDPISHGGRITAGSGTMSVDALPVARKGDPALCTLHGAQTITGGSTIMSADGKAVARVGDAISCGATITGGSPTVVAG